MDNIINDYYHLSRVCFGKCIAKERVAEVIRIFGDDPIKLEKEFNSRLLKLRNSIAEAHNNYE